MTGTADRAAQRSLVERFARERPGSVLYDASGSTLLDVFSGKTMPLDWGRVAALEERVDAESRRPYLAVRRENGAEFALTDAGVAFPPDATAIGLLTGLPNAVCFRDLAGAEGQLEHFLAGHPGDRPAPEHVTLFLFCLAVVDGARAAGFDVSREERRLEHLLGEMETRRRG